MPTSADLTDLLTSNSSILFVARYPNLKSPIVGILTLVIFRVPSGIRAHIEDLVVDQDIRNKGIASALVKKALHIALKRGAHGVILTSNSNRISAVRLYERIGFKKWDTNVFYFEFER